MATPLPATLWVMDKEDLGKRGSAVFVRGEELIPTCPLLRTGLPKLSPSSSCLQSAEPLPPKGSAGWGGVGWGGKEAGEPWLAREGQELL